MIIKKKIKKINKKKSHNFYKFNFLSTLFTFGLLVLVFVKNYIKNKINYHLVKKNKKKKN